MSLNRGGEGAARGKQEPLEHVLVVEKVDRKEGPRASSLTLTFSSSSRSQHKELLLSLKSQSLCAHQIQAGSGTG